MCTAIACSGRSFFFGRTLDHTRSYGEEVVIVPRNFPFLFRARETMLCHHAIIGMAHVADGYPLLYDAMNEHGLCMAGLNFEPDARYPGGAGARIAPFELMPWVLGQCRNLTHARELLSRTALTETNFSAQFPAARLHWLIADRSGAITVESTAKGLHLYDNPMGVLTNDPPFPEQLRHLRDCGMLPGDLSSPSRFCRAVFTKSHASPPETVCDFFRILDTVTQVPGCNGEMFTRYTSCCDGQNGLYCYTTTHSRSISALRLHGADLSGDSLLRYPLETGDCIQYQN